MSSPVKLFTWVLLLLGLSGSRPLWGQTIPAPPYQWARAAGGAGDDRGKCVGVDAQGNAYVSGTFEGTATVSTTTLTSRGVHDAFLAKYSPTGQMLWVRQLGGPGEDYIEALTVNAAGTVYVTGFFTRDFYAPSLTPASIRLEHVTLTGDKIPFGEMFLASYDAAGSLSWARQTKATAASSSDNTGLDIALDGSGNVYVVGKADEYTQFDHLALALPKGNHGFVAKYSPAGVVQWVSTELGQASISHLAVDATGQCYVMGLFWEPFTVGGTTFERQTELYEPYVAKLNLQGQVLWAQQLGTPGYVEANADLQLDAAGNLLVAYIFAAIVTHGSHTFTARGGTDVLVLQYSPQGAYQWGVQFGGSGSLIRSNVLHGLSVDAQGNSYFALGMVGMSSLTQASGTNDYYVHVVSLTGTGNVRWARLSPSVVSGLAATATGEVYTTGHLEYTRTFDSWPLTSKGSNDGYMARLGVEDLTTIPTIPPVIVPPVVTPTESAAWVPNIITPNGDRFNETFRLTGLGVGPWQLQVYSRWGKLVYQQVNYQQDWSAADLPAGLYYYHLQAPEQPAYQGWLQVAR